MIAPERLASGAPGDDRASRGFPAGPPVPPWELTPEARAFLDEREAAGAPPSPAGSGRLHPGLLICRTECTQRAWGAASAEPVDPSQADLPISAVHRDAVDAWCEDMGLRLPTEVEWTHACRAGTHTEYWFGDDPARLEEFAWLDENTSQVAEPVARKPCNAFGLHDVHGNVWEWCQGSFDDPGQLPIDPHNLVSRGGGWNAGSDLATSAYRSDSSAEGSPSLGFRPACSLPSE